jgi:orotate phosphoribosyltransferase
MSACREQSQIIEFDRLELARRIYDRSRLTGEFTLRSGVKASTYFDKYLFESDPALLREVAGALLELLPDGVDALAGLELGGVPLVTVASQLSGLPTLFVRKHAKAYGTCRLAESGEPEGRRLAVIEDVITSGGQVIESCRALSQAGFDGGFDPWFCPRGERAFWDAKSEEVSTGVDRARCSSGA